MNIMELGPIGELVGGVAVIGSLLFYGAPASGPVARDHVRG